eukprot:14853425-Alexandrium_andersonii.AAC.1
MAQTIGLPRARSDSLIRELSCLVAPRHSVVVGDNTLAIVANKSNPEFPEWSASIYRLRLLRRCAVSVRCGSRK